MRGYDQVPGIFGDGKGPRGSGAKFHCLPASASDRMHFCSHTPSSA